MTAKDWLTPETAIGCKLPCGATVVGARGPECAVLGLMFDREPLDVLGHRAGKKGPWWFNADGTARGLFPDLIPPAPQSRGVLVTREALRKAYDDCISRGAGCAAELIALAERVEALTGPCRETDAEIAQAVGRGPTGFAQGGGKHWVTWPAFTRSLDAAMSLRLDGYRMSIAIGCGPEEVATAMSPQGEWKAQGKANTTANAITAAWLRARAAQVTP